LFVAFLYHLHILLICCLLSFRVLKIIIKLFKSPLASWAQSRARPNQPLPFGLAPACCHPQPSSRPTHLVHLPFSPSLPSAGVAVALCAASRHAAPARKTPTPPMRARGCPGLLSLTRAANRLEWSSLEAFLPKKTKIKSYLITCQFFQQIPIPLKIMIG
jgi:hypothetical protein